MPVGMVLNRKSDPSSDAIQVPMWIPPPPGSGIELTISIFFRPANRLSSKALAAALDCVELSGSPLRSTRPVAGREGDCPSVPLVFVIEQDFTLRPSLKMRAWNTQRQKDINLIAHAARKSGNPDSAGCLRTEDGHLRQAGFDPIVTNWSRTLHSRRQAHLIYPHVGTASVVEWTRMWLSLCFLKLRRDDHKRNFCVCSADKRYQ